MTYYQELGLGPDATLEEIRQAHRNLSRMLHPDQQSGEALKRLAEAQMKRLNSLCDELTDAERRRRYDSSLTVRLGPPASLAPPRPPAWRFGVREAGFLAAGMAAASLCWELSSPPARSRVSSPSPSLAPVEQVQARAADDAPGTFPGQLAQLSAELARTRGELEKTRSERDSAFAQLAAPESVAEPAVMASAISPVLSLPEVARPAVPPRAATPPGRNLEQARVSFAGTWVYVRPRMASPAESLYPAEYIEAVIVEQGEVIKGRYRARYDVMDRPISPQVTFQFEGRPEGESASLRWSAAGGAKGELKLKLLSRNSMEANWMATELGSQPGLASGIAVLIRKLEP
jgi:curved DNA-binding protein CbpA